MGYVSQDDVMPITAKKYLVSNWEKYDIVDTKDDFVALLNILQACGEHLDSLHDVCANGRIEFCDIYCEGWSTDREVVESLLNFCTFYTEQEFIDMILNEKENYDDMSEYVEEMRREATDDPSGNNDVQITKTEDGYVKRIWY